MSSRVHICPTSLCGVCSIAPFSFAGILNMQMICDTVIHLISHGFVGCSQRLICDILLYQITFLMLSVLLC